MKFLVYISVLSFFAGCSGNKATLSDTKDANTGVTTFSWSSGKQVSLASKAETSQLDEAARLMLAEKAKNHGINNSSGDSSVLELVRVHRSKLGPTLVEYRQTIDGFPVLNSKIVVVMNQQGKHLATSGSFHDASLLASRSFRLASHQAVAAVSSSPASLTGNSTGEPLKVEKVFVPKNGKLTAAYGIERYDSQDNLKKYYVDAATGETLIELDMTVKDEFFKGEVL